MALFRSMLKPAAAVRRCGRAVAWLLAGLAALATCGSALAADRLPLRLAAQDGGVDLAITLSSAQAGEVPTGPPIDLQLTLADGASATALRGLRPRVWLSRRTEGRAESCMDLARRFASGRLSQRADRDLNNFLLVTLNADASVSVINPQVGVGSTRLESLITLPGVGGDWALAQGGDRLLVTLPQQRRLAVIDMTRYRLIDSIDLGEGEPRRLVVSADQRQAYVAMDRSDRLLTVDLDRLAVVAEARIGRGLHNLVLTDDGRQLVATSSDDDQVTVLDTDGLRVRQRHRVPGTPVFVAWSPLARLAYVAPVNDSRLWAIDPTGGAAPRPLPFERGISALRADPSGRFLVGVREAASELLVLDTANGRLVGRTATVAQPDQVVFSRRFAYVRGLDSLSVTLLDLASLADGRLATNQVPMFQQAAASARQHISGADMLAPSPEGDGVIAANGADTALYYYTEGMMAPQGTYRTYSRAPRGLLVLDRSLREAAPGDYRSRFSLDKGGRYTLTLLLDQPRVVRCLDFEAGERRDDGPGLALDYRWADPAAAGPAPLDTGRPHALSVQVRDSRTGAPATGLADVQLMVLELPGLSQQRQFARETAPGVYSVEQRFPRPGRWRLSAQIPSRGLGFDQATSADIEVHEAAPAAR